MWGDWISSGLVITFLSVHMSASFWPMLCRSSKTICFVINGSSPCQFTQMSAFTRPRCITSIRRSVPLAHAVLVITYLPPKLSMTMAVSSESMAKSTSSKIPLALAPSHIHCRMGLPHRLASIFLGKRVEARRAGIMQAILCFVMYNFREFNYHELYHFFEFV